MEQGGGSALHMIWPRIFDVPFMETLTRFLIWYGPVATIRQGEMIVKALRRRAVVLWMTKGRDFVLLRKP